MVYSLYLFQIIFYAWRGSLGRDRMLKLDLRLPVQSLPITTEDVSSNPAHHEMYLTQHYVTKFVSNLRQIGGFLRVHRFPPGIKLTVPI